MSDELIHLTQHERLTIFEAGVEMGRKEGIDRIVAKAVAAERDRCHRLAVLIGERHAGGSVIAAVDDIASAIRDSAE